VTVEVDAAVWPVLQLHAFMHSYIYFIERNPCKSVGSEMHVNPTRPVRILIIARLAEKMLTFQ
jgi:hypothetical protein